MRVREEDSSSAVEAARIGTFAWDVAGGRVTSSSWLARMWGCELDGSYEAFVRPVHPEDRAELEAELARCASSRSWFQYEFRVIRPDGSAQWIWARGEADAGDGTHVRGVMVDVKPGKHVDALVRDAVAEREGEVVRLTRLYAALRHVNQAIVVTPERAELLPAVCRVLCERGGFSMSWVGWHEPTTGAIAPVASWGDDTGYLRGIEIYADARPEGRGPVGTAFREQRPCISNDLMRDPSLQPWHAALLPRSYRSVAAFPIRESGEVRATLAVYAAETGFFRADEIALLTEAASNLSFALDKRARDEARRLAEARLRQELDFSEGVLRSLPGVLYMYDEHGQFLRWNENFERASGYTRGEIATMHPLDFFARGTRREVASKIDTVFDAGAATVEAALIAKDGTSTPFHFTGVKAQIGERPCLIGVGIDLSERYHAQRAREVSETRYRTLFDHAPDGILIVDDDFRYIDVNPAVCRMLGYSRDELVGRHAREIVADGSILASTVREAAVSPGYRRERTFRRKDGSTFPAEVIATVMPDGNMLGLIRDVSARKQTEQALRDANESLETKVTERTRELNDALVLAEAADHLKSAFLATMSHELRTPLNSIIGFTGIVLAGMAGPLTAEQETQLGMVRGSARHLLELINDVLDISKIEAEQLEIHAAPFEVRTSLDRVLGMIGPLAAAKGLALDVRVAPAVGTIVSDRRRVEQILLNLLNNAVKFTERGTVTLAIDLLEDETMQLRVTDTGIGIREEELATLFQPFRQLDTGLARRHEGTGLGLAICRRLATLLGGTIVANSTWGRGSELTVALPLTGVSRP